jgi:hypothetical protein
VRLMGLKLTTKTDARLGMCSAVYAPNAFLVHEPAELVKKKIASKGSVNLADCCWLRK